MISENQTLEGGLRMSKKPIFLMLFSLLIMTIVISGCDKSSGGQLSGKIYDSATDQLITKRVTVVLAGEVITVRNGEYLFTGLSMGDKTLEAKASGYRAYTATVKIEAGKKTNKDIHLAVGPEAVFYIDEALVPSASNFPTGKDDLGVGSVNYRYYMAKYEVTYQLWKEVYDWATDAARGAKQYYFQNTGQMGSNVASSNDEHPVTKINWRDAMVWCNALTEYYNDKNDASLALECVYIHNGRIVRDSRDFNDVACDSVIANDTDGYRLPTSMEWELAARYQNGVNWTSGSHVSGDTTGPCYSDTGETLSTVFDQYVWYPVYSTNPVGGKLPNALDIYDMSGNVWEWCFDLLSSGRLRRGGSWTNVPYNLRLYFGKGREPGNNTVSPGGEADLGFRTVRTW